MKPGRLYLSVNESEMRFKDSVPVVPSGVLCPVASGCLCVSDSSCAEEVSYTDWMFVLLQCPAPVEAVQYGFTDMEPQ